jgi:SAM-dependent methyltransferase
MDVDYQELEEAVREGYRQVSARYRGDDEIEVLTRNHFRLARLLKAVCQSFPSRIRVLDLGCGTGRYFHCLPNVSELTGIDISEDMLAAARAPVLKEQITAERIRLCRGNACLVSFPAGSFDFVYSLGMFGHGCPVTVELCNRIYDWMSPGGKFLFNVVDSAGLPVCTRMRRWARRFVPAALPKLWRPREHGRRAQTPLFALTKGDAEQLASRTRFSAFAITPRLCDSPLWQGRHLECLASKDRSIRTDLIQPGCETVV